MSSDSRRSQVLATAVLLIVLFAILDKHNGPSAPGTVPVGLFLVILGLGVALGMETSELFSFIFSECLRRM